jgi:very-short-patch-repair endonuclease
VQRARDLRAAATPAEQQLWAALRGRQLLGLRFRRQHIVGGYIVDLYCPALRLAIEVDGDVHLDRADYDAQRDAHLIALGVSVLRIRNEDVLHDLESVRLHLDRTLRGLLPLPPSRPPPDIEGRRRE